MSRHRPVVRYHARPLSLPVAGSPIELFECKRIPGNPRLQEAACGARWKLAEHDRDAPSLWHCRGCDVGKANATKHCSKGPATRRFLGRDVGPRECVRCAELYLPTSARQRQCGACLLKHGTTRVGAKRRASHGA